MILYVGIISKLCIFTSVDRRWNYPHALGWRERKPAEKRQTHRGGGFGDPNGSPHFAPRSMPIEAIENKSLTVLDEVLSRGDL